MRPKRRVYRRGRLLQLFVWSSLKLHRLLARLHMGVNGRRNRGTNVEASTTSRRISANLVVWKVGDSRLRLLRRRGGGGGGGGGWRERICQLVNIPVFAVALNAA